MAERGAGAIVVGFRRDDRRRYYRHVGAAMIRAGGFAVPVLGRSLKLPPEYQCHLIGGRCLGCGCDVYLNQLGASAIRERDADVVCTVCESRYPADIDRAL